MSDAKRKMKPTVLFCLLLILFCGRLLAAEPEFTDVFVPKADGFKSIRIPAVVVTKQGALLAFAEGRAANADQAQNKLILKRSTDGGRTWGKLAIIADDGQRSLNNPCAVVEHDTGQVLLAYQSYPADASEFSSKLQPGLDGPHVVRSYLITSDDDGLTWSPPRDVTRQMKRPTDVTTLASGPGIGIQLRNGPHAGRLLIPFNQGVPPQWNVCAALSDDRGKTWTLGENAPRLLLDGAKGVKTSTVNEAQLAELSDGSVRFSVRRRAGKYLRKTAVSHDGGATWSPIEDVPELRDPDCQGSIYHYPEMASGKNCLLYSGPQSDRRENCTVFASFDDGATWPVHRVLWKGSFAYSCLTSLPDGTLGCLLEADNYSHIVFARFNFAWLRAAEPVSQRQPQ